MEASKRPVAALAGVAFTVVVALGALLYPSGPDFVADPGEIADFYNENDSDILRSNVLYLFGGALLLIFLGFVRSVFAAAEGAAMKLTGIAFGAGITGTALLLGAAALDAVAALRVDEHGSIEPATATVYWDASAVLFGLAAPMAMGIFVLGASVLSFTREALPKWLGVISVILGIALLVPPINFAAMIAFTFWPLIAGIVLYLRPSPATAPA